MHRLDDIEDINIGNVHALERPPDHGPELPGPEANAKEQQQDISRESTLSVGDLERLAEAGAGSRYAEPLQAPRGIGVARCCRCGQIIEVDAAYANQQNIPLDTEAILAHSQVCPALKAGQKDEAGNFELLSTDCLSRNKDKYNKKKGKMPKAQRANGVADISAMDCFQRKSNDESQSQGRPRMVMKTHSPIPDESGGLLPVDCFRRGSK